MKELKAFVASSYNEQKKLCGYGILLEEEYTTVDFIGGVESAVKKVKTYQVAGYLTAVLEAIAYAIEHKYEKIIICYNFSGAEKYTKIKEQDGLSQIVKDYISDFHKLEKQIEIEFEKVNLNRFVPHTNLKQAQDLAKKVTMDEEFDKYHLLNPKNFNKQK